METQSKPNDFNWETGVSPATEEFKELKPDSWIDLAVRQCLNASLIDPLKYALAVRNLQSVCINKIDEEYTKIVNEQIAYLKAQPNIKESSIDLIIAPTRFDELMRLIRRTKTEEQTFDL